jgi:hypothetical protein
MSHAGGTPINAVLFLILIGGGFLYSGLRRLRQAGLVEDTPLSEIKSAAQGLVEIQGYALPFNEAFKTLSGHPAIFHELTIQRKVGKNWETLYHERLGSKFVASDGTGLVLVELKDAELIVQKNNIKQEQMNDEARAIISSRFGIDVPVVRFFGLSARYKITERAILVGSPVYLRGAFFQKKNLPGYSISPAHIGFLRKVADIRKVKDLKIKSFDLNRDGRIDVEEVAKGSKKMLFQTSRAVGADETSEIVSLQGSMQYEPIHGLMIADTFQEYLKNNLNSHNVERIIGGMILIAAGVGMMFVTGST